MSRQHFAIGMTAEVRAGAKPAGWGDEPFTESRPIMRPITDVGPSEEGSPLGTFEVGGWFWDPRDVIVLH
jgi:hypothetical protein